MPDGAVPPWRTAVHNFPMINAVARCPLALEADETGVAHQNPKALGASLQPVDQMAAVARACGRLTAAVNKGEKADCLICGFEQLGARRFQGVTLDPA